MKLGRFLNMFISVISGQLQCYGNSEWCYFSQVFLIFRKLLFILCWIFTPPTCRYLIQSIDLVGLFPQTVYIIRRDRLLVLSQIDSLKSIFARLAPFLLAKKRLESEYRYYGCEYLPRAITITDKNCYPCQASGQRVSEFLKEVSVVLLSLEICTLEWTRP